MQKKSGCLIFLFCCLTVLAHGQDGNVKIVFRNIFNGHPLVLDDSTYNTSFGEQLTITKLKYYISHPALNNIRKKAVEKNRYYLIDQRIDSSLYFSFSVPENNYESMSFLAGVDSAMNCSGAQTGALDPLNDMFWTWNSGYIMFKLEGNSPQSNLVNNKVEYHVGGYSGQNSVLKYITLSFPSQVNIDKNKKIVILIDVDLAKLWRGETELKIKDTPVCSIPGSLAKQIAENFSKAFSIRDIIYKD